MVFESIRAAGFAALLACTAGAATGQDASLTARDGSIRLEGTMLGYDGEFYRLTTEYGTVTVDAQTVDCEGPGCPDLTHYVAEIRLSGARAMGEVLLPALIEAYALHRSLQARRVIKGDDIFHYELTDPASGDAVARLGFHLSTTAEGFADLVAEATDLAMAVREPRPDEVERSIEAGVGDLMAPGRARTVALDGLVPVVAPGNPLHRLSLEDLGRIWAGEISNWSDLGLPSAPIRLHEFAAGGGFAQAFDTRVLAPLELERVRAPEQHAMAAELVDAVSKDAASLGMARFSELGNARPVQLGGTCGRDQSASRRSLKAEDYPLALPLYLFTAARRLPLVGRDFLDWLTTPQAELVVRRAGFVDQVPERVPMAAQGGRLENAILAAGDELGLDDLQEMLRELDSAERLTTVFRFREGSAQFAPQSEGNIGRLARDLQAGVHDGTEILLVGFSDGQGPANANLAIAMERAETVAAAIRAAASGVDWSQLSLTVLGFGEAMPLACDDSDWGRQINRRVEVWVRPLVAKPQR